MPVYRSHSRQENPREMNTKVATTKLWDTSGTAFSTAKIPQFCPRNTLGLTSRSTPGTHYYNPWGGPPPLDHTRQEQAGFSVRSLLKI